MEANELNFIDEEIREDFFYYVKNKFGNGPKSKVRALEEALEHWISKEEYSMELSSLINDLNDKDGINAPRYAAHALKEFEDKKSVKALIKALKHKDTFVRRKAAISLGHLRDESSINPLINSLKDEDSSVRDNAVWALAEMGELTIESLIDAKYSRNNYIRAGAISAIHRMALIDKLANLNRAVIGSLNDEYNVVRRRAIKILGKMNYNDNEATYSLIQALNDEDLFVKENALLTLGQIGNEDSIKYIIQARSDDNLRIQEAAEQAWSSIKERIVNKEF